MKNYPAVLLMMGVLWGGSAVAMPSSYDFVAQTPSGDGWRSINPQPLPQDNFLLQSQLLLRAGDQVTTTYRSAETLMFHPNEVRAAALQLDSPVRDVNGNTVVPAGAWVYGQFVPAQGGSQFVAESMELNGYVYSLRAESDVIPMQRDPRRASGEAIARDAAIGAGLGLLLGGLTGDRVISAGEVIGGAAASAVIGNVTAGDVMVIRPDTLFNLRVLQDFRP